MKMKKMKMQEVLGRADMSVEKGRALDAVFATLTVDKKAKRLSSKQKAHLASQVDTSVENIQDYWLCYRRKYLKRVRRTVLFSIGILCEQNFFSGKEAKHFLESLQRQGTSLCQPDQAQWEGDIRPQL